ncbi:hypothetical protein CSUI_004118 [Cystoisospora suis]|uniref:Uncharacterized protein n=1 Tax=Cystoisospora suis TaxID=483139 RepID=A0A2C6L2Y8_9APIC|nr:hypothetical protein CSUI_004118 [Cystoisospora suis]
MVTVLTGKGFFIFDGQTRSRNARLARSIVRQNCVEQISGVVAAADLNSTRSPRKGTLHQKATTRLR